MTDTVKPLEEDKGAVTVPQSTPAEILEIQPASTDPARIRNFCIIAHIDHGKSTLADRMLGITGVLSNRDMRDQYLDRMDIERERGITIKSQAVRMPWSYDGKAYALNMIDTPGHVDFSYEVSRSLAACEGAVLLVDAAQGVQAQTLANLYMAMEHDLAIIPVLNKIDLPSAMPEKYTEELAHLLGVPESDILQVSGKTGSGVAELLDRIVAEVPAPLKAGSAVKPSAGAPEPSLATSATAVTGKNAASAATSANSNASPSTRAMIFDSVYDMYRGVVTYVRVVDGQLLPHERVQMMGTKGEHELLEIGVISPEPTPSKGLGPGEVGYLITGVKDVRQSRVGDTITDLARPASEPLAGYKDPKPMVYSGIYPIDGSDYPALRDALDKLKLNDAALTFEPETSVALGFGFRCGFLGLLHLEIITERLQREFGLDLIATSPSVNYRVIAENGEEILVSNPSEFPEGKAKAIYEPMVDATILTPKEYVGAVMELCQQRRGTMASMDYLSAERVELNYRLPLAEIVTDFFDQLKSRTRGYASLDYKQNGEEEADLVKVNILLNHEVVDAFSAIVHRDAAYSYGVQMTTKLKQLIPRQQFEIPVQAAIGLRIIARSTIKAVRKDVLAKCYGGDVSRKRKLLEKQKEGKKRMKSIGRVDVPQEAFIAALSSDMPESKNKK